MEWKEQNRREEPSFYCGDELHLAKAEKVQKLMLDNNLDALLLFKSEAVRYVTDFYVKGFRPFMDLEYFVVVPKGSEPVVGFSSGSDTYRIKLRSFIKDSRKLPRLKDWPKVIVQILRDYSLTKARIGTDLLPFNLYLSLKDEMTQVEFIDISELWIDLTVSKHPKEIELIKASLEVAEIGLYAAMEAIRPGAMEIEVAACAEYAMRTRGSEMSPVITQIASGANSAFFERIATTKRIRYGELVIIDLGAVYRGYTGDVGRTVVVGKASEEQKRIYQVNYKALQAAIEAVKPGVTCADIDAVARSVIREEGYEKYEHKFATGHQLGYGLHGEPLISRGVQFILKPRMVFNLEPRVTIYDNPEIGGSHIEDTVLVTDTGHEVLSKCKYDEELLC